MLNMRLYSEKSAYQISKIFREKEDSFVALMRRKDGSQFVCRAYDHPVPGYGATEELSIPQIPVTYCCKTEESHYIVEEEYVDGISLAELMEVYRPDESQTAAIGAQVCHALHALHEKGVIHRDIKPDNVLITSAGRVVLIDLDAASQYDPGKDRDTTLLGTAGYAAPEQFGFSRSDVRTDIFSLGVMMNVMLTGEHPSRKLADGAIRSIIERCIEVNADKRYSTAEELEKRLTELGREAEICSNCGTVSPGGGCLCCGIPSARARKKTKWGPVIAVVLFAVLIGGVFAGNWFSGEKEEDLGADITEVPKETEKPSEAPVVSLTPAQSQSGEHEANLASEHKTSEMPIYEDRFLWGNHLSEPFEVSVGGVEHTVCLCVGGCGQKFPNRSCGISLAMEEGEYEEWHCGVGFYRQVGEEEYARIEEAEVLDAIQNELGDTLKLEVFAYNWDSGLPKEFPLQSGHSCYNGCYEGTTLRLELKNRGYYVLRATGTAQGKALVSEVRFEWSPTEEIKFNYDSNAGELIDQINSFLSSLNYREGTSVSVQIPAGTYEGQIVIPASLKQTIVSFNGSGSDSIIKGGIENQNHLTRAFDLRFEGAGSSQETWPDARANVALSGSGGVICNNCEFSGYHVAIASVGRLKTGTGNRFVDNHTAFLIDTNSADGGSGVNGNEYRNNKIAIHFKNLNDNWPTTFFDFSGSRFVDNEIDLKNELGREVFFQGCYFADTLNGVEKERECHILEAE